MRVLFVGAYGPEYPRNAVLRRGLATAGHDLIECRADAALPAPRRWLQLIRGWGRARGRFDVVFLAEFNNGLAAPAFVLARLARVPLAVDFLISLWDTGVNDRGLRPHRPRALYRRLADWLAIRLADLLVVDTQPHAEYFEREFGGVLRKARVVQVGAAEWEASASAPPERDSRPLTILYLGHFIPLHGVEHVIGAARLLQDDPRFRFLLVGAGQMYASVRADYDSRPSNNVEFRPPIPPARVPALIAASDISLGIFGASGKAKRVVANKVWQAMAAGRPVVTGDGAGARAVFEDERHLLLVPHGDASAIAAALRRLADDDDLARRIATSGADLVREKYSSRPLGRQLADALEGLLR